MASGGLGRSLASDCLPEALKQSLQVRHPFAQSGEILAQSSDILALGPQLDADGSLAGQDQAGQGHPYGGDGNNFWTHISPYQAIPSNINSWNAESVD
jgi:hypothetical protein